MRRRGLAMLAYVAVTGPVSRDHLADLLWPSGKARSNLRVELHRLNDSAGTALFEAGADPLRFPAVVELVSEAGEGELFEGLEGISGAFDAWIESQRAVRHRRTLQNAGVEDLARSLAVALTPPFLVLTRAKPGEDVSGFARRLGDALRLPVMEGNGTAVKAIHLIAGRYPDKLAETVLASHQGGWVVRVPAYGEDPGPVLELRNLYDPARLRYVELPPVSWQDARASRLALLPFDIAAEAYLWSGGNEGLLRELADMRLARTDDGRLAVPQRVRAAYEIELRHASMKARLALERLSVHPGRLSNGLVDMFEARHAVDELERRGWLTYDGGWRFRDSEARNVLYDTLQPGRRAEYHRVAARQMDVEGRSWARAFHTMAAGQRVAWSEWGGPDTGVPVQAFRAWMGLPSTLPGPVTAQAVRGRELALLEIGREGPGVTGAGADWTLVRFPGQPSSAVTFELPDEPCLLHVGGRAAVDSPLGVGLDGDATPLELQVAPGPQVVFIGDLDRPVACSSGIVLLPLAATLDHWLLLPSGRELRLVSKAYAAVLELELTVHAVRGRAARDDARGPAGSVAALDLAAAAAVGSGDPGGGC
ncbi:MAG TPA: hypothetical protein VKB31_09545 [Trueperaceae bacterium]|nr:hypothetical protein [Trueperaceae bacterium]